MPDDGKKRKVSSTPGDREVDREGAVRQVKEYEVMKSQFKEMERRLDMIRDRMKTQMELIRAAEGFLGDDRKGFSGGWEE